MKQVAHMNINPRYDHYPTAAMDSCFVLVRTHATCVIVPLRMREGTEDKDEKLHNCASQNGLELSISENLVRTAKYVL